MVDDEPLAEGWEAVTDDEGRTYWWNTETNETTWTKPVAVVAKKGLAAGGGPTSPRGPPQPGSTGSPRSIAPLDGCRCSVAAGYLSKVAGDKPEEKSSQLDDLARLRQQGGTARPDSSSWQRRSFPPTARGALVLAHGATPPLGSGQSHGHLGCPHSRPGAARRRRSDFASGHPGHRASQACLVRATAPRPYVAEAAALCTQAVTMPTQAAPAAGSRLGWRSSTNRRRWRIIVAPAQSPLQRKTRRSSSTAAWWAAWPLAERSNTSATAAEPHTRGTHPLRTCTCAPAQPAHTQSFPRSAVHSTYTPRWPSLPSSHRPSGHSLRQEGDCQGGRASPSTRGGYEQRSCRRGAYAPR